MEIKKTEQKQTPRDIIKDFVTIEKKGFYTSKEVDLMLDTILEMLTDTQRLSISQKAQRCEYYLKRKALGMNETKIRGLLERTFKLQRQYINTACEPCKNIHEKRTSHK